MTDTQDKIDLESDTQQAQQTGGTLLGEGLYGCAFDTPFKCKNPKVRTSAANVAKLTTDEDARAEIDTTKVLLQYPNASWYFALVKTACTPAPRANQKRANLDDCKPLKGVPLPSLVQLTMPYGGKPLISIPHKVQSIRFFPLCQHMLEAATILLIKGLVHNDLHMNNILCDTPSTTKFIDFGITWSPKHLTNQEISQKLTKVFDPKFLAEPPEETYRNGILDSKRKSWFISNPSSMVLAQIQDKKPVLDFIYLLFGIPKEKQARRLKRFIEASQCVKEEDWITFFSLYWSKIDAWAIGVAILFVYLNISTDPLFEQSADYKQFNQGALSTIKGLCDTDPRTRLDAAEALRIWNPASPLLQDPAVQGWLKKQDEIRKLFPAAL